MRTIGYLSLLPVRELSLKVLLFANTDWYLYNFRRSLAEALRETGHDVVLVSPLGPYGERLRSLGFRWEPAPMKRRSLNPVRELNLVLWLVRMLRRESVDLVHGFTIKCAIYGALAARLAGTRGWVSAVAGMGYVFTSNNSRARMLRPPVRMLLRLALDHKRARLILQNPDDLLLFTSAGLVHPDRARLIAGSGVDTARFQPTPTAHRAHPFRVLLPARLVWDKGIAEFIGAARQLLHSGRDIRFLLAGNPDLGNPAAVAEADVRTWVAEGLVEWLGHSDDMPALLNSVDVVVLPSYREGLPRGLIEAAACGLPLVTTDAPGCRHVVEHEQNGLLVPVKDAPALAAAIARLHDDASLRARLGAAARQHALARFDERSIVSQTLDVYRELVPACVWGRCLSLDSGNDLTRTHRSSVAE